ncbi:MAG: SprT family zinc-dependent metalloprotease [Candidatus Pacebacteria bacterium]|nr:SprT family zinc-dependent metalloprotease [Candidatus Paceibacterota bacterium]
MIKKKIIYEGGEILFTISKNRLSKRLRLSVNSDGDVKVTMPKWLPEKMAEKFILSKLEWILEKIKGFQKNEINPISKLTKNDYFKNKEKIRKFITEKVKELNSFYDFKIGSISIRDQKTRWGSCSSKGNLNFSYKLFFLPKEFSDYIIVHEICHIKEMNHSLDFWNLVSISIPDYRRIRKELKKYKI